jgi:hypothetical protein
VLDEHKEHGRQIAAISASERNKLIARLIFGRDWERAGEALGLLMESWGAPVANEAERVSAEAEEDDAG